MKVGVLGAGHVGIPTAVSLAHLGHQVIAADANDERVELLLSGRIPYFEPGLEERVRAAAASGLLAFTSDVGAAIAGMDVVGICVDTPPLEDGEADLGRVEEAADAIARHATGSPVVVVKSTVPIGSTERIQARLREGGLSDAVVVSSPEFLREGQAVEDALHPFRVIVGTDVQDGFAAMRELYAPLIDAGVGWIETDFRTAELTKYACNAFLATKISYANALARLCEHVGADVQTIVKAMGLDPRIGPAYLGAGLGFGGSCLPKDIDAFERTAERFGYRFGLLEEVRRVNDEAIEAAREKLRGALGDVEGKRIALLGLAFKPETDDIRSAPALALARRLLAEGAVVTGYDPVAGTVVKAELPELELAADAYEALDGADAAVLCTEWDEFRALDLDRARELMAGPVLVDGRNLFEPARMAQAGFRYLPTGRPGTGGEG
jgi:UDPglucose 6-dehydrogenase